MRSAASTALQTAEASGLATFEPTQTVKNKQIQRLEEQQLMKAARKLETFSKKQSRDEEK
jgi:hypothetical protein